METEMSVIEDLRTYRESIYSFIDFLDDRKDTFQSEINDILKMMELRMQQWNLKPREKYADHLESEKLEQQILEMADNLPATKDIADESRKLNIVPDHYTGVEVRNSMLIAEHLSLSTIDSDEVGRIISSKNKYVAFRKIPNINVLFGGAFLYDLDTALYSFFEAFTDVSDMDWMAKTFPETPETPETPSKSDTPDTGTTEAVQIRRKQYEIDTLLVREIFSFCQERGVFVDEFTEIDLINRLSEADLSGEIYTDKNKLKIRTIVYRFYRDYLMDINKSKAEEWYTDAVKDLRISKSECSKNYNEEFSDGLHDVIESYVNHNLGKNKH